MMEIIYLYIQANIFHSKLTHDQLDQLGDNHAM